MRRIVLSIRDWHRYELNLSGIEAELVERGVVNRIAQALPCVRNVDLGVIADLNDPAPLPSGMLYEIRDPTNQERRAVGLWAFDRLSPGIAHTHQVLASLARAATACCSEFRKFPALVASSAPCGFQ